MIDNNNIASRTYRVFTACEIKQQDSDGGDNEWHRLVVDDKVVPDLARLVQDGYESLRGEVEENLAKCLGISLSVEPQSGPPARRSRNNKHIILFPTAHLRIDGYNHIELHQSTTVCYGQSRSKIWTRLTERVNHKVPSVSWDSFQRAADVVSETTRRFYWQTVLPRLERRYTNVNLSLEKYFEVPIIVVSPDEKNEPKIKEALEGLDGNKISLNEFVTKYGNYIRVPADFSGGGEWVLVTGHQPTSALLRKYSLVSNPLSESPELAKTRLFFGVAAGRTKNLQRSPDVDASQAPLASYAISL